MKTIITYQTAYGQFNVVCDSDYNLITVNNVATSSTNEEQRESHFKCMATVNQFIYAQIELGVVAADAFLHVVEMLRTAPGIDVIGVDGE